jgi:hypothetical protein
MIRRAVETALIALVSLVLDVYVIWPFTFFSTGMSGAIFWTSIVIVGELVLIGGIASRSARSAR